MSYDAVLSQNCAKWCAETARGLMEAGDLDAAVFYERASAFHAKRARQLMEIE